MTVPRVDLYLKSVQFNSHTYDKSAGGPLTLRIDSPASPVAVRTGDGQYPTFVGMVDPDYRVTIDFVDMTTRITIGTKGSLVLVGSPDASGTNTKTYTITNMVFMGFNASVGRASPSRIEGTWMHESADGTTFPETIT